MCTGAVVWKIIIHVYVVKFSAFVHVDGLKQNCSNSIADALELQQSVLSQWCNGLAPNRRQAINEISDNLCVSGHCYGEGPH